MHEMSLTRSLVDMVLEEAEAAGATEVRTVYLALGDLRDIVEELFDGMFAFMAKGTLAERAKLVITRAPFTVKCNCCKHIYHIDEHDSSTWSCSQCKERDYVLNSDMEFSIKAIELVVDKGHAN